MAKKIQNREKRPISRKRPSPPHDEPEDVTWAVNILEIVKRVGRKAVIVAFFAAMLPAINLYFPGLPKWFADLAALMSVIIVGAGFAWIILSKKD